MLGEPTTPVIVPHDAKVVHPIWTYGQKGDGTFNARGCINGKQLVRMGMQFQHAYAACIEHHCLRLFVALAAYTGLLVINGDVDARGSTVYFMVDEVFQEWYTSRYLKDIVLGACVPLYKAYQGHPEAGNWWELHFNAKCAAPLKLKAAFTEPIITPSVLARHFPFSRSIPSSSPPLTQRITLSS
jgi:hypothetical protein